MLRYSEWRQPGKLGVQRGCILTITLKQFVKNYSNFYGKIITELYTTFMLNDFSFEQIIKVEKFQLYRLFSVNSFTQGWSKITNTKLEGLENSQKFTQDPSDIKERFI